MSDRAPVTACITVNFHGTSVERQAAPGAALVGKLGYGRYPANVGNARILAVLARRGIKATFFVSGFDAEAHPDEIEAIVKGGHEIASNGYCMEDHTRLGDAEEDTIVRAHEALRKATGQAPKGWRAPHGLLSTATLGILARQGYAYDSSFQDDFTPYPLAADGGAGMVELPQNEMLIDATLYGLRQTHNRVMTTWIDEFDAAYDERAFICLTLHPRSDYGSGRASRIDVVERFIDHVEGRGDVVFRTCAEAATLAAA